LTVTDNSWNIKSVGKVDKRMICGGLSGKKFWELFEEMIFNPATKKNVFIFTGKMLSKDQLQDELNKTNVKDINPEVIQLIYLIRSTWTSVSSVGANLKIFCY